MPKPLNIERTVYALLVGERVPLLGFIPFDNKPVPKGECGAGICSASIYQKFLLNRYPSPHSQFIAIE